MPRASRRDALLDATAALAAAGDVGAVSMDAVAQLAGVSRPLVYKHFANRQDLISAVYEREVTLIRRQVTDAVLAAPDLEGKFRAMVHGLLVAQAERGAALAALRSAGGRSEALRKKKGERDRTTVLYFARQAEERFGIDEDTARRTVSLLLRSIEGVLAEWHRRPSPRRAELLEDTYVAMAMGTLERVASLDLGATLAPEQVGEEATTRAATTRRAGGPGPRQYSGRVAVRLAKHVEIALGRVELSLAQYRVLVLLERGSAAASALASKLVVSPPSVTAIIDGLVARGLVQRRPVAADRRRVDHVLTAEGRRVLRAADAAVGARLADIARYLPPARRAVAAEGLQSWLEAMDAYIEERVVDAERESPERESG
jgi:DNA-binding MarR family transcriptional regulator/AcrR family transcriptional regulator